MSVGDAPLANALASLKEEDARITRLLTSGDVSEVECDGNEQGQALETDNGAGSGR